MRIAYEYNNAISTLGNKEVNPLFTTKTNFEFLVTTLLVKTCAFIWYWWSFKRMMGDIVQKKKDQKCMKTSIC